MAHNVGEEVTGRAGPVRRACLVVPGSSERMLEKARSMAVDEIVIDPSRLEALVLGYADLGVSLGRSRAGAAVLDRWLAVQDAVLAAARAAGLQAIDGPHLAISDDVGLSDAATRAADLGF